MQFVRVHAANPCDTAVATGPDDAVVDGLRQRALLFERILADLRGRQTILDRGMLPEAFAMVPEAGARRGLSQVAMVVVRCPDGIWRVAADFAVGPDDDPAARLLEAPALSVFLPGLSRFLMGESLRVGSVPTRWFGDPRALTDVVASRKRWALVDALRPGPAIPLDARQPTVRTMLQQRVEAAPWRFAARIIVDGESVRAGFERTLASGWTPIAPADRSGSFVAGLLHS